MSIKVNTYRCPDCEHQWDVLHKSDEPDDDLACPRCETEGDKVPSLFTTTSHRSRAEDTAVKMAHAIAEKQYGMTDMRDNQREGDIAFKSTPAVSKAADGMFSSPMNQQFLAGAKSGPQGANPIEMLHKGMKDKPFPFRVIDAPGNK